MFTERWQRNICTGGLQAKVLGQEWLQKNSLAMGAFADSVMQVTSPAVSVW